MLKLYYSLNGNNTDYVVRKSKRSEVIYVLLTIEPKVLEKCEEGDRQMSPT